MEKLWRMKRSPIERSRKWISPNIDIACEDARLSSAKKFDVSRRKSKRPKTALSGCRKNKATKGKRLTTRLADGCWFGRRCRNLLRVNGALFTQTLSQPIDSARITPFRRERHAPDYACNFNAVLIVCQFLANEFATFVFRLPFDGSTR